MGWRRRRRIERQAERETRRRERREQVLEIIARAGRNGASAFEIGAGLTNGSVQGRQMNKAAKELLGLKVASALVQDHLVIPTQDNRFMLAKLAEKAVPPMMQREDMPSPGFWRIPSRHTPVEKRGTFFNADEVVFVPLSGGH
jgi:hypothetical protein